MAKTTRSSSDEEAAFFLECAEWLAEIQKASRCSDPRLREAALAYLTEEGIQLGAKLCDKLLEAADKPGEEQLITDEGREAALEGIGLAVDRPDWYRPGARVVLPDEDGQP